MGKKVIKSLQDLELISGEIELAEQEGTETVVGELLNDLEELSVEIGDVEIEIPETVESIALSMNAVEAEDPIVNEPLVIDIIPEGIDSDLVEEITYVAEIEGSDPMDREAILAELTELYSMLKLPYVSKTWENMETIRLYDLLSIVRKDAGGSIEVASLIQQTKEDFEVAISSEMMKSRLRIVDQKSADQTKINQRLTAMLGSDVVINGARTREYHDMVREYVKYIVTFTQKVNSLAQFFNITLPLENEFPNGPHIPVLDEMPCTPVNALYILNVLMATMDRTVTASKYSSEALERSNNTIEYLTNQLKAAKERNDDLQKSIQKQLEETKRLIGNSSYWIVKDEHGRILQKNDPDKPLETPADLNLHGTIDTALFFTTARSAEILVERLSRSRRFKKHTLNSYRVSIVQQTFNEKRVEVEEDFD